MIELPITLGGGISYGQHAAVPHTVVGTYTGDGMANRVINLGARARSGMILGADNAAVDTMWFLVDGAEAKFAFPDENITHIALTRLQNANNGCAYSTATGFTLAAVAPFTSNVIGTVYYYVVQVL